MQGEVLFIRLKKNEPDAAFMHGNTLNAGAITGVTTVKNPISLARDVMEQSKHVLFAGEGAEIFADEAGVERVDPLYFRVEETYERWKKIMQDKDIMIN